MKPLSRKINLLLILVLSISLFVFAGGITIYLKISKSAQIHRKMQSSLAEYTSTLEKGIDEYMDGFCVFFKHLPAVDPSSYNKYLKGSVGINDYVTTLSEADGNGIILYSSDDSFMGTPVHESGWAGDMYFRSGQLEGSERLFEVGVSREDYDKEFQEYEKDASLNWNVGNDGFILICDESGNITAGNRDHYKGVTLSAEDTVKVTGMADTEEMGVITVSDRMCLMCSANGRGQYILSLYPADALKSDIYGTINMMVLSALLLMIIIYFFLKYLLRKTVVDEMGEINASLKKITEGDLEVRTNVRSSLEMSELSDGINITVDKLEDLIRQADAKYDEELLMAKTIQQTSLPHVFPPYPNRNDFGLFASMETAKEVGGDFYDFFMLPGNVMCVVMADVSDKGIPAAMFMMRAKTAIRGHASRGLSVDGVMEVTNNELVEGNAAGMFVTVWIGFVHLDDGRVEYVHAGHTCPVLLHEGRTSFIRQKRNLIVGAKKDAKYTLQEFVLEKGDSLFLYTDGVTEAFDTASDVFGNDRLCQAIEAYDGGIHPDDRNEYAEGMCRAVGDEVAAFTDNTPQSDDITMLCLKYCGGKGENHE